MSGGSRFIFAPRGGCCPAEGVLGIAANLADAGQTFFATIRARDDDQLHSIPDRTFEVHVGPPAPATLEVKLDRYFGTNPVDLPPSLLVVPGGSDFDDSVEFRIRGVRTAIGGVSIVPLTLSSSWEFPIGTPQAAPAPPGALTTPAMPISGLPNPIATFRWAPQLSQLGQHRLRFSVSDGQSGTMSAFVDIDVRPFTIDVVGGGIDNATGVITISAWNDFLRATLTALDPSFVVSFPSLPAGAAEFYSGTPVGNIAVLRWRAMGVQYGINSIPVQVAAGAQTYTGNLTVNVGQFDPSWWFHDSGEQTRVLNPLLPKADFAIANQGQVKHMARMAALAIKAAVNEAESNQLPFLISQAQADSLLSMTQGLPPTSNFTPCNQGQVKNLAASFYEILTSSGVLFPTDNQPTFPWSLSTIDDANYAPVNIGQIKALFGFDPASFYTPFP